MAHSLRILHLLGDWKWTGPAEPVLSLCAALRDRGHDVRLACQPPPDGVPQSLPARAKALGIEPLLDFHLDRYLNVRRNLRDLRELPRYLDREGIDILHLHQSHDHTIGGWAARRARRNVLVVRTNHKGTALRNTLGNRYLIRKWTDGYMTFSAPGLDADRKHFHLSGERSFLIPVSLDLSRFDPSRVRHDLRPGFGYSASHLVIAVVARMQRHRRIGRILEGLARAVRESPAVRGLFIGRGTHREKVAVEPARRLGLERVVTFTGYLGGNDPEDRTRDRYVEALHAIDALVLLVPGSDGTCRAVREAMAMGKVPIVSRRGLLPELVQDGHTGLLVKETPADVARAVLQLAKNPELRLALGLRARQFALDHFDPEAQARAVEASYRRLLSLRG